MNNAFWQGPYGKGLTSLFEGPKHKADYVRFSLAQNMFLNVWKDLISAGHVKPGLELMIFYAEHEGEDFIEEILYPFGYGNQKLENRQNRAPRFLFDFFIEFLYADDANEVSDLYSCEQSGIFSAIFVLVLMYKTYYRTYTGTSRRVWRADRTLVVWIRMGL